jgi:hypothetical protein
MEAAAYRFVWGRVYGHIAMTVRLMDTLKDVMGAFCSNLLHSMPPQRTPPSTSSSAGQCSSSGTPEAPGPKKSIEIPDPT